MDTTIIPVGKQKIGIRGLYEALTDLGPEWDTKTPEDVGARLLEILEPRNYFAPPARPACREALAREYFKFRGLAFPGPEAEKGLEIRILGQGCPRCRELHSRVLAVLSDLGLPADVEHVTGLAEITALGVVLTPGIMINGVLKASGRVPTREEIARWLS